jgi:hypothetical protein
MMECDDLFVWNTEEISAKDNTSNGTVIFIIRGILPRNANLSTSVITKRLPIQMYKIKRGIVTISLYLFINPFGLIILSEIDLDSNSNMSTNERQRVSIERI